MYPPVAPSSHHHLFFFLPQWAVHFHFLVSAPVLEVGLLFTDQCCPMSHRGACVYFPTWMNHGIWHASSFVNVQPSVFYYSKLSGNTPCLYVMSHTCTYTCSSHLRLFLPMAQFSCWCVLGNHVSLVSSPFTLVGIWPKSIQLEIFNIFIHRIV